MDVPCSYWDSLDFGEDGRVVEGQDQDQDQQRHLRFGLERLDQRCSSLPPSVVAVARSCH